MVMYVKSDIVLLYVNIGNNLILTHENKLDYSF